MSLSDDRNFTPRGVFQDNQPSNFWERFESAFDECADEVFVDRLHPLKVMSWSLRSPDISRDRLLDYGDHHAQSAFAKSVEYSLREASVSLPLTLWLGMWQDSLTALLLDSVDAVEEESVSPLNPSYRPAERGWWKSLAEKQVIRYGIRPLRTNPYAFFSLRIREGNRLLLLGHVRYYYRDFADHQFQVALSLPLFDGFAVDVGTSYQFGRHDEEKKVVFKLFKPLKNGGIAHVGIEAQRHLAVIAGISLQW